MPDIYLTNHAAIRMQQRGFRQVDIALLLETASQIAPDAFFLKKSDAVREIAKRKREIQQLERLCGKKLVIEGGALVTCYHAQSREEKRSLRNGRAVQ